MFKIWGLQVRPDQPKYKFWFYLKFCDLGQKKKNQVSASSSITESW